MNAAASNAQWYATMMGCLALPAFLAACASPDQHAVAVDTRRPSLASGYRVAQLGHGDGSYFGFCLNPVCPAITPKTKAVPVSPVAPSHSEGSTKLPMSPMAALPTLVVHFPTGSAVLGSGDRQQLSQWSTRTGHSGSIVIAGRTDDVGAQALNHRLASARASAVADYLRDQLGVAPARLAWEGRGVCCYVRDNATDAGRRANRRAEITFHPLMREEP